MISVKEKRSSGNIPIQQWIGTWWPISSPPACRNSPNENRSEGYSATMAETISSNLLIRALEEAGRRTDEIIPLCET